MKCVTLLISFLLSATFSTAQTHKLWLDVSNGFVFMPQAVGVLGPGVTLGYRAKEGIPLKLKVAYHRELDILSDFLQHGTEVDAMIGEIIVDGKHTIELYAGVGMITGVAHGKKIGSGLFSSYYERRSYTTIGIPVEAFVQWKVFGFGIEGNINLRLPYGGIKTQVRIPLVKNST